MAAIFDATDEGLKRVTGVLSAANLYHAVWWVYIPAWPASGQTRTLYMVSNSANRTSQSIVIAQDDTGEIYLVIGGTVVPGAVFQPGWHPISIFRNNTSGTVILYIDQAGSPVCFGTDASLATWTLDEMYLGIDPRTPTGGVAQSVAYFREWPLLASTSSEWTSPTPVRTSDLATNTPLHSDLLDTTVNDHDWVQVGGGTQTFTSLGGTLTGCFGALVKTSALILPGLLPDNHHGVLMLKCSSGLGATAGRTIAQFQFTPNGFVFWGHSAGGDDTYTAVSSRVDIRYGILPTSSNNTSVITLIDPIVDPGLGISDVTANGPRNVWYGTYKFAIAFKCSSYISGAYQADGFVKAYLNDDLLAEVVDVVLPRGPFANGGGTGIEYTFGIRGDGDRAWARDVATLPTTDGQGAFTGGTPSGLLFFDDFDGGLYPNWTPRSMYPGGSTPSSVYTYSDCGGDGGYGVSAYAVSPSSSSLGGIGTFVGLYRWLNFPPFDPDPTIEPPPPPPEEPEEEEVPGGIYTVTPTGGIVTRHDRFYGDIENKIPDPTVRTALLGE